MKMNNGHAERRTRGWVVPLAVAVCVLSAPVLAADLVTRPISNEPERTFARVGVALFPGVAQPRLQPLSGRGTDHAPLLKTDVGSRGFIKQHLAPRLAGQMRMVVSVHALETVHNPFGRAPLEDWYGTAPMYAERGIRKALRDYVLVETSLGSRVEAMRVGRHGVGRPAQEQAVDYGIDFYHGIPQLEMRHRSGAGTVRIGIGLDSATLRFRPALAPSASVVARCEYARSRCGVTFRHIF